MKLIILLAGYGSRMRPLTWSRAKALMNVAGNTTIGHLLDLMSDITDHELIFVVGYKGKQIEEWIRSHYPHLNVSFVVQDNPKGQAHAVWLCRHLLDDEDQVVVAFGDGIVDADYGQLSQTDNDGVILVKEVEDPRSFGVAVLDEQGYVTDFIEKPEGMDHKLTIVGINWFRRWGHLREAIAQILENEQQTLGEYFMVDAYKVMLENGCKFSTQPVKTWLDAGQPKNILLTNKYMLSTKYGSPDALERGYAEGFTVVPPVYIHPTADIEASVIGPFATIDAGVKIRNAIVRNAIIDEGAEIEDCILEDALVGQNSQVSGQAKSLFVGDNSNIQL